MFRKQREYEDTMVLLAVNSKGCKYTFKQVNQKNLHPRWFKPCKNNNRASFGIIRNNNLKLAKNDENKGK